MELRCVAERQIVASFPSQFSFPASRGRELILTRPDSIRFIFPGFNRKRLGLRRHRRSFCQATLLEGPAFVLVVAAAAAAAAALPLYLFGESRRDGRGARASDETESAEFSVPQDLDVQESLAPKRSGVTRVSLSSKENDMHVCPDVHDFSLQLMESSTSIQDSAKEMHYADGSLSYSKKMSPSEPKAVENGLREEVCEKQLEGLGFDVSSSIGVHQSDEIFKQTMQNAATLSGVSGESDSTILLVANENLLVDSLEEAKLHGELSEVTIEPVVPHVVSSDSGQWDSNSLLVTKEHFSAHASKGTKQDGAVLGSTIIPAFHYSPITLEVTDADTDAGNRSHDGVTKEGEPQVRNMNGSSDGLHGADPVIDFEEEEHVEGSKPDADFNMNGQNANGFSSLQSHLQQTQVEQLTHDSLFATGNSLTLSEATERNILLFTDEKENAAIESSYSTKPKSELEKSSISSLNTKDQSLTCSSLLLEIPKKDERNPTKYISIYNHLLRDGRLSECIELLESMRRRHLLDMDKVYHAKFLMTCKTQKAVREAFHFVKLIERPSLSTFNMLMSVCASSQDFEGAFQVLQLVAEAGLKADCKLCTTLISTCAKSGKVDAMFEVFHEMVSAGIEPNLHTYGALIDGCAKAGQVAKAFGAYGIMRSKKVNPDRVVFNALITACGQSGAVDRAFDVLAEMRAEPQPIDPDHVTVGALMRTCSQAGQVDRALEVYKMMHKYNIKGTPEVYTIAINCCSQKGDLDQALKIYDDMKNKYVLPDEVFFSALIDVAGHAGKVDVAFKMLKNARRQGIQLGNVSYSSLMGACCNAKDWQKALELYVEIKAIKLLPSVSTMNALITSLCDGDQLEKSVDILAEMKNLGVSPNSITYSVLLVACDKKGDIELAFKLLMQARKDGIAPNLIMCKCFTGLCLQRFEKASSLGEPILSFSSGNAKIDNKWTSWALAIYRDSISSGVVPTVEVVSQVLGCLQIPYDTSLRNRILESVELGSDVSKHSSLCSLLDGFGEYDPRSFSLLEEAASLGVVPCVSFKGGPITVDATELQVHIVEVYLLTILKGLRHRLAAGAKIPSIIILLPVEKMPVSSEEDKIVCLSGRVGQAVGALLRRLNLSYQGSASSGKIRISVLTMKRWFQPTLESDYDRRPTDPSSSTSRLARRIADQQRSIRGSNLSIY
ncbi:pentatricopeptide repeat-containing protein MRL1, chloroplastic isoform X1 [Nymphaea colorata]|nr:pentatricopeptide repeat-containing protein MRL1, chloroplastic isoform X1 [Nymphaea colorata]